MATEEHRKLATALAYLSRLVMIDAPPEVITPLKQWCKELEADLPEQKGGGWRQGMTISDTAKVKMVDVGGKN